MSTLSLMLVGLSLVGIVVILLFQARTGLRESLALLLLILIISSVNVTLFPLPVGVARGNSDDELWLILALYVCLILGMLAQHAYVRFSRPRRRRRKFDVGTFLAPIFASPIVFIPLLATIQAAGVDLYEATGARFMLFLLAFENGFFWKVIFDQRRELNLENEEKQ